jgi:histone deacetylase 6
MDGMDMDISMEHHDQIDAPADANGFVDPRMLQQPLDFDMSMPPISEMTKPLIQAEVMEIRSSEKSLLQKVTPPIGRIGWLPTGCCYDDRMKLHANADFSGNDAHPEDPRRIESIMNTFKDAGLVYSGSGEDLADILRVSPTRFMYRVSARVATKAEICTVHTAAHYDWVEDTAHRTSAELRQMTKEYDMGRKSLYVSHLTHYAALISAGGAIETCKNIVAGNIKNGIAVIRPPGHHAERDEALGFCLFNNVPIATRVCQTDYPETCRKVLILDWDVHHGNGVQNIFYDDPNVLYISLHVYQDGQFYPGQPDKEGVPDGHPRNIGRDFGEGRNVNIGWHAQDMGDGEYMAAFQKIVMPMAQEFGPDLVIVSAGFDAAEGDALGGCHVTPACYSHMTHMLMSLAGGKVAVCLEGGYDLHAISVSALAVARTLMGEPPERMVIPPISRGAANVIEKVIGYHAPYWECLRSGQLIKNDVERSHGVPMDDVIRSYQFRHLFNKYKMTSLYIQRDKISQSFENQVLATQGLHKARNILVIIHDP